jgi:hypothetical protein
MPAMAWIYPLRPEDKSLLLLFFRKEDSCLACEFGR